MARLLKCAFLKASSNSKLCSFATKANPYVEVLKTLKLREQDLQNECKISSLHKEEEKTNLKFNAEHYEKPKEKQDVIGSENLLHIDDFKLQYAGFFSNNFSLIDRNLYSESFDAQSHIEMVEIIKDSKNKAARPIIVLPVSETQKKKKKNTNQSKKTKSFNPTKTESKITSPTANLSHTSLSSKILMNSSNQSNNNIESIPPSKNFLEKISIKSSENDLKTKKKKLKKSKTDLTNCVVKNLNDISSTEHSLNLLPSIEIKSVKGHSSDLNVKSDPDILKFSAVSKEKTIGETVFDKEFLKTKGKSKSAKKKTKTSATKDDQKQKAKLESAIQSLKCLVEAYINASEINKAHRTFEFLLLDKRKKEYVDVDLYNIVISGWAREGRLDKVKHLFSLMSNQKISPNLQSYAGYFEAISRSKCVDVDEIPKIVNEMKSHRFSPKELLQKCTFVGDQREKVIEALGFVERDLSLPLYVPDEAYCYKLLEKLNDRKYEKGTGHFDYCYEAKDIQRLSTSQLETEEQSTIKIKSVNVVADPDEKIIKCREYIKECENVWRKRLTKAINNLKTPKKIPQGILGLAPNQSIYPYLTVINTDILVNLLLQETRMLGETAEFYSPNIKVLYRDLGLKVMRHYFMGLNKKNNVTDKVQLIYQEYMKYLLDPSLSSAYLPREYWEFLKSKHLDGPTIDVSNSSFAYSLLIFIGSILYDVLRSNICFNPNCVSRKSDSNFMYPAFHIVYENHDVKLNRQIRAHDMFSKLYRDAKLEFLDFDVSIVPMICPPRPWIKYDSGGLIVTKVPFIRFPEQARSQSSYYSKVPSRRLNPCFDSLNNLSTCPWIINKPILDIVIKIFQDGGSEELDIPLNPANYHMDSELLKASDDDSRSFYRSKIEYEKKKCEMTSLWYDCLYKLSIANHFRDVVFWFPHNLDFRGRVYPTPPHFNHLGSDMSRSILLFAAGKPLGNKGLDWLKMHLINLTGFKKRSPHVERLAYANEILPEILDSADNPFGEKRWWMKSDKPLQTLACCIEVANAVRHPNPPEYISHFPVHQDGSCNGLQHYAALGRDELGAIEVNLHPSSSPQDVYSGVAALVEKERERDAIAGLEIAQALEGFVTRKVVKQTVMTFVYGVTPYGARLQVLKQLKDMPDFPEKYQHVAATYLMKKIFYSIKEMFTATKKIQDWFTICAEEITRVTEDAVEWITPLGLPVIQPYFKETIVRSSKFCLSKGNTENINHYVSHFEPYQLPNIRKQKNAFAPNFIHSLDSTHMMLTSLFCHRKDVTFVSVHDCYWTHASTVKEMNKICREQFVSLHSERILENLSEFFLARYANSPDRNCDPNSKQIRALAKMRDVLSAVPDKGTFNLKQVLNSEYFFS